MIKTIISRVWQDFKLFIMIDDILIGTSGYDYPEWKGVFYPDNLARKDFLLYYSTKFNALELNSTFYSMPTFERMERFIKRSEGRVNFSVKAHRLLTHEISSLWKTEAEVFKNALKLMNQKNLLSSILFQFPQSFHYNIDNRFYLSYLLDEFEGFPVAVEFRNKQWILDSVFEGLAKRNAAFVYCDMPDLKHLPAFDFESKEFLEQNCTKIFGNMAYLRLHGRNADSWYASTANEKNDKNGSARYEYFYSDEELFSFVPIVKFIKNADKRCQIFFNNHPKGYGAQNALKLKEMLQS